MRLFIINTIGALMLMLNATWAIIQLPAHDTLADFLNRGGQGACMVDVFRGYEKERRDIIKHEFNNYLSYVASVVNTACLYDQNGFRTKLAKFNQFRDRFADTVASRTYKYWTKDLIEEVGIKFLQPIALSAADHISDDVFGGGTGIKAQILGTFKHRYSETVIQAIKQCLSTHIPVFAPSPSFSSSSSSSSSSGSSTSSSSIVNPTSYFIANLDSEEPFRREHRIPRGDDFTDASIFDARFTWVSPRVFVPASVECEDGTSYTLEEVFPPSTLKLMDKKLTPKKAVLGSTQAVGFELIFDFKFGASAAISGQDIVKMLRNRPGITRICELQISKNASGAYDCKLTKKGL